MRLLDRYLFRELLTPLAYCLIGIQAFIIVFTVYGDAQKIQESKLHFVDVVEYATASSVDSVPIVIPVSLLLALLLTLSNFARHNEITAMRAAGISLWRICLPYFGVGLLLSVGLFFLNEFCVPRGADWADRILNRYIPHQASASGKQGFLNDQENRKWTFDRMDYRKGELDGVQVNWSLADGSTRQLNADRAIYTNGVWTFYNASEYGQYQLAQTNMLAMPEFKETPREMRIELKIGQYERLGSRKTDVPLADILNYMRLRPGIASPWLQTQLQERFAMPLTCLVVVLIAIPFSVASGRRNLFFGVAGSIFICFAYIVIQRISIAVGQGGHLPGWLAAWSPDFLFAAAGIFLTARVR
jgi:lipopolysaccharide export system permease protein